jgi:hypothetical protein
MESPEGLLFVTIRRGSVPEWTGFQADGPNGRRPDTGMARAN